MKIVNELLCKQKENCNTKTQEEEENYSYFICECHSRTNNEHCTKNASFGA